MAPEAARKVNVRGQGSRLRIELLDAADRLLAHGRDAEITLRGVAREAGVAAPSVYDHFPRLDDLLDELADRYLGDLIDALRRARLRTRRRDAAARLRAVARAYLRWGMNHPGPYVIVFERRPARPGVLPQEGSDLRRTTHLLDTLAAELAELDPAVARPALAATALWTGLHGIVSLRTTRPAMGWPALNRHLDAVLAGVLPT